MEKALANYGEALKNHPGCQAALDGVDALVVPEDAKHRTLAVAFAAAGFTKQAVPEAEAAARKGPGDPRNFEVLARAYLATGRFEDALKSARKALSLDTEKPELVKLVEEIGKVIERSKE